MRVKILLKKNVKKKSLKQNWKVTCILALISYYDSLHFIFSIIVENVAEQSVTSVVKTNLLIQSWVLKILFACVMNVMKPSQMMSKSDY